MEVEAYRREARVYYGISYDTIVRYRHAQVATYNYCILLLHDGLESMHALRPTNMLERVF